MAQVSRDLFNELCAREISKSGKLEISSMNLLDSLHLQQLVYSLITNFTHKARITLFTRTSGIGSDRLYGGVRPGEAYLPLQ